MFADGLSPAVTPAVDDDGDNGDGLVRGSEMMDKDRIFATITPDSAQQPQ